MIDRETKARMRDILRDIQTGVFARDWIEENHSGKARYDQLLAADLAHPIEEVGARLRRHMAWLQTQPTPLKAQPTTKAA